MKHTTYYCDVNKRRLDLLDDYQFEWMIDSLKQDARGLYYELPRRNEVGDCYIIVWADDDESAMQMLISVPGIECVYQIINNVARVIYGA